MCNIYLDSSMTKGERGKDVTESYTPNAEFKQFLKERLHHEKIYQEKLEAGKQISNELQEERSELNRKKSRWLNKCVFPSMANLTIFLEYIAKNEELWEVFDDDLRELFIGKPMKRKNKDGSVIDEDKEKSDLIVFQRFIQSAITWNWKKKKNANNFRLVLINCLEYILFQYLTSIVLYSLPNSAIISKKITEDLTNTLQWSELLARSVDTDVQDASRPVLF
jgi:hypothetical protein